VDPRPMVRLEGSGRPMNPVAWWGIEPATFRLCSVMLPRAPCEMEDLKQSPDFVLCSDWPDALPVICTDISPTNIPCVWLTSAHHVQLCAQLSRKSLPSNPQPIGFSPGSRTDSAQLGYVCARVPAVKSFYCSNRGIEVIECTQRVGS
jgi:hypothetical protein